MSGTGQGFVTYDDTYDPSERRDYSCQHLSHDWFMATADDAAIMWNKEANTAIRYNRPFSLWFPKGGIQ